MYDRLLLATDGSERAGQAARHAVALASSTGATLHVLFVVETRTAYDSAIVDADEMHENLRAVGTEALSEAERLAAEADVACETAVEEGVPAERIEAYVRRNDIDLVVVGEHGHAAFRTVLLGSTAEAVVHAVDVPVTVV